MLTRKNISQLYRQLVRGGYGTMAQGANWAELNSDSACDDIRKALGDASPRLVAQIRRALLDGVL